MSGNGKVAIVTGGAAGIGLGITQKFIDNGIKTYVIGRNKQKTDDACENLGPLAVSTIFDLTNLDNMESLVKGIMVVEGRIDILVNNAGINMKKPFTEVTDEDFKNIMHTNVYSIFAISKYVVRAMEGKGAVSIINISSMAAQYGIPYVIAYTASKSAIEGMTKAMAVELAEKNVRVNAVAPGFIKTRMTDRALNSDPARKAKVMGRTPMGVMGEPMDIANAVFYLAGEEASYVTGVTICVDGGNSIGF